jgi:hypothetical protein
MNYLMISIEIIQKIFRSIFPYFFLLDFCLFHEFHLEHSFAELMFAHFERFVWIKPVELFELLKIICLSCFVEINK